MTRRKKKGISLLFFTVLLVFVFSTVAVSAQTQNREKVTSFVTRLYENFLGREPEQAGLDAWVDALITGRGTAAKVVYGFVYSPEFQSNPLTHEDYVTAMYETVFGRTPDEAGLKAWVSVLDKGCTRKKVLEGFLNSREMENQSIEMGVVAGKYRSDDVLDNNTSLTFFINRFYEYALGRKASEAEMRGWVQALADEKIDGVRLAVEFLTSSEYRSNKKTVDQHMETIVRTLMDRDVNDADKEYCESMYLDNFRNHCITSADYAALCASYGVVAQLKPYNWGVLEYAPQSDSENYPDNYKNLVFNDRAYHYWNTCSSVDSKIKEGIIGDYIADVSVVVVDSVMGEYVLEDTIAAKMYGIKNVSEVYAVAVKLGQEDDYLIYWNPFCVSESFGDFMTDAGIKTYGVLNGTAEVNYNKKVTSYDEVWVLNQLASFESAPIAEAPARDEKECVAIGFMMPDLAVDKYGYSITILENGYVTVSGYGSATFFIGEDAAQEFLREFAEHSVLSSVPGLILEEGEGILE